MIEHSAYLQQLHNQRKTHIEPYNSEWPKLFAQEAKKLLKILAPAILKIEHIGSTAIPGIKAKPIIDILITTKNIADIDSLTEKMEKNGYISGGEFGLPGRRFFCSGNTKHCYTHVHIYEDNHPSVSTYLTFRDYMINHPNAVKEYEALKTELARKYPHNRSLYTLGKNDFITSIIKKAAALTEEK